MEITRKKLKQIHRFIEDNYDELSKRCLSYRFPIMPFPIKFQTGNIKDFNTDTRKAETLEVIL